MMTSIFPDKHRPGGKPDRKHFLFSGLAVLFWLAVWQIASFVIGQEILLVSPVSVLCKLLLLIQEADFWKTVGFSFLRIFAGFFSAAAGGCLAAALAYRFLWLRALMAPPVFAVKATPVASFIILCLVWIPSRNLSVVISFLMVFPIIYLNLLEGLGEASIELREMAHVFRVSPWKRIYAIYWPQCMPYFISACSLSLGLCWKSGVAAEVIGLPDGSIGEKLYQAKIFLQTDELFAWTIVVIGISVLFEKTFLFLLRTVFGGVRGNPKMQGNKGRVL